MERLYGLTGKIPAKPLAGQAAIVFAAMGGNTGLAPEFKTAKDWTALVETLGAADPTKELKTRQDPYRVVLYYILIFKKRELVASREQIVDAPTDTTVSAVAYTAEQLENPQTEDELQAALARLDEVAETVGQNVE